jgi:hypothetical protein
MVAAAIVTGLALAAACTPPKTGGGTGGPGVTAVPAHGGFQMVASMSRGFYSLPYPNAVRKIPNGGIDLRGLPGTNNNILAGDPVPTVPLLPDSIGKAMNTVTDFGTNTPVYFSSTVDIDPSTLPQTGSASLLPDSTVMLIDLDHGYALHPVLAVYEQTGDRFRPNRLLSLLPYPGHPLQPATNYAAVIFDGVHQVGGDPIDPAPLISQLDHEWTVADGGDATRWAALRAQRDAVRQAVTASTDWSEADIAAFTVYRTQDTSREIDAIEAALADLPAPTVTVTSQAPCAVDATVGGDGATNSLVQGTISMPDFQQGTYPYLQGGGQILLDTEGKAIVQRQRSVPVRLRVPCGPAPLDGWPTVGHIGDIRGLGNSDTAPPPYYYDGYVFAEVPALMAGATSSTLTTAGVPAADQPSLLYANFINPYAGRANPLQQAANHISLLRALEAFTIDGATVGTTGAVGTDDSATVASGHAQGSSTLPLVATAAANLEGVFSSSGAGGLYHSLAHTFQRTNLALFTGEDEPLDELNPLVQVVQTVSEASDGINVGAAGLPSGLHYLNVTGTNDGCVAAEGSRHFATAMGLGLAKRQYPATIYGDALLDPPTVNLPAGANGPGGATRVQLEGNGDNEQAAANRGLGTSFLASVAAGTAPTVPNQTYFSTYGVCGWRYDALGGDPFGRI